MQQLRDAPHLQFSARLLSCVLLTGCASVNSLSRNLAEGDPATRLDAVRRLDAKGSEDAAQALVPGLQDAELSVRQESARALTRIGSDAVVPLLRWISAHPDATATDLGNVVWVLGEIGDRRALRPIADAFPIIEGNLTVDYFTFPSPEKDPKATHATIHNRVWSTIRRTTSLLAENTDFALYNVPESEPDVAPVWDEVPNPRCTGCSPGEGRVSISPYGQVSFEPPTLPVLVSEGRKGYSTVHYTYYVGAEALSKISGTDLGGKRFLRGAWRQWTTSQGL